MSDFTKYFAALLSGDTSNLPEPDTKFEKYLAKALGIWDGELPEPENDGDALLYEIAVRGIGGGGGGDLPTLINPAAAAQILAGYEAINAKGGKMAGTMVNHGVYEDTVSPIAPECYLAEGYYDGASVITVAAKDLEVTPSDQEQVFADEDAFYRKVTVAPAQGGGGDFEINDAGFLFYQGRRLDAMADILKSVKNCVDMQRMFSFSSLPVGFNLSALDTSAAENMSYMFSSISGITALDLRSFDTGQVTDMSYMFSGASTLESIDLSSFNTSNVANMTYMFNGCSALTSVDLSNFDTGKVDKMTQIFGNCTALTAITGFSASKMAGVLITFPYGTSSVRHPLKRLTFRTDITHAIRSNIRIDYCSFDRSGLVECFNTLGSASGVSSSNKKITITGNPCVTDGSLTAEDRAIATDKGWTLVE